MSESTATDVEKDARIASISRFIDTLQEVIHRFSDVHFRIDSSVSRVFWQRNDHDDDGDAPMQSRKRNLKDIVNLYAPVGLESQFEQLYGLLHSCLVARDNDSNAAAFCLGNRGMGKSMLVDRCLQAFQDELRYASSKTKKRLFRVVKVHGVLIPGHDVGLVVRDMLQQLSETALAESAEDDGNQQSSLFSNKKSPNWLSSPEFDRQQQALKKQKTEEAEKDHLRLRLSTFDSNLQLLGETLQIARVDQIPILIVLDEVDAFLDGVDSSGANISNTSIGNNQLQQAGRERQLLLYHLLDRVATQGSNCCLIGLTQNLVLRSKLEKRIKSRMEGTSKEIFFGNCPSMSTLSSILLSHVLPNATSLAQMMNDQHPLAIIHQQLSKILTVYEQQTSNVEDSTQQQVWNTLEREYRLGRNVRWFLRVFYFALSLYRGECIQYRYKVKKGKVRNQPQPKFEASHILDALVAQGASIAALPPSVSRKDQQQRPNSSLAIMSGNAAPPMAVDPRIQALLDLSPPQVALVLAARRILARDAQWNGGESAAPPPLTLGRMLQEYCNFKAAQQRFSKHLLWISFLELLEINLFRPASDNCGTGSFQYHHQTKVYSGLYEAEDLPLHILVDVNRELMEALQNNVLECSTAMREWGRKTNT